MAVTYVKITVIQISKITEITEIFVLNKYEFTKYFFNFFFFL
jgi:hypothetical protein